MACLTEDYACAVFLGGFTSYLRNGWSLRAIENCIFSIRSIERNMRPILRTVRAAFPPRLFGSKRNINTQKNRQMVLKRKSLMKATNISGAAGMIQIHMHVTFIYLAFQEFYIPVLLNICDLNTAEIFHLEPKR
jgi:hypothetical protein